MEFLKNLWKNSPSLVRYLGLTGIVIVYLIVSTRPKTPNFRKMIAEQEKATEIEVVPYKSTPKVAMTDIEYMKKCAQEVRLMRMNWYFEETGMTTTSYSSAPQDLQNYYDTYDIEPNTGRELPYKDCSPSARYK